MNVWSPIESSLALVRITIDFLKNVLSIIDMYYRSTRVARVTLFQLQLTISFKFLKVQLVFVLVVVVFISGNLLLF